MHNQDLDYNYSLFKRPFKYTNYISNIPNNYTCYLLDDSYIKETDKFGNEINNLHLLNILFFLGFRLAI